jgi:membrane protein implicated in regulation of membrane protease activity
MGMRILRNLDLIVLGIALPVVVAAGLPLLGWGAAAAAWIASRVLQAFAERRTVESGERRVALGARAASLVGRLYIVGLTVLGAGLIERKAGATAGAVSVVVFTVWLVTLLIVKPLEEAGQ